MSIFIINTKIYISNLGVSELALKYIIEITCSNNILDENNCDNSFFKSDTIFVSSDTWKSECFIFALIINKEKNNLVLEAISFLSHRRLNCMGSQAMRSRWLFVLT